MKKVTRILALLLVTVMVMECSGTAEAASVGLNESGLIQKQLVSRKDCIDQDTAATIGLLFVTSRVKECKWNESTQIEFVRPLFAFDGTVGNYYIALRTDEKVNSYVMVSANPEKPLITEFSDDAELLVSITDDGMEKSLISELPEQKPIYYDSLMCATFPIQPAENECSNDYFNTAEQYRQMADDVIGFIDNNNISVTQSGCYYGFISNPVTYLQGLHPDSFVIAETVYTAYGSFSPYYISDLKACFVYATACILRTYMSGSPSFSTVLATCKNVAETYGYASYSGGTWNYYMALGSGAPFVRKCITALGLSKNASSSLWFSQARNELTNHRACILNISSYDSVTIDHSVVAYALAPYTVTTSETNVTHVNFYKIIDGDCTSGTRYACEDSISGFFVTKIY